MKVRCTSTKGMTAGLTALAFITVLAGPAPAYQRPGLVGRVSVGSDAFWGAGGPAGVSATDPGASVERAAAAWGSNVKIDGSLGNNPTIDANPADPDHLIAVYDAPPQLKYKSAQVACSGDHGDTWSKPDFSNPGLPGAPIPNVSVSFTSHPWVGFGPDGTAYIAYQSTDLIGQPEESRFTSILVVTTKDCLEFRGPFVVISVQFSQPSGNRSVGGPVLAADFSRAGRAYISFNDVTLPVGSSDSQESIHVVFTEDGGEHWADPETPSGGILDTGARILTSERVVSLYRLSTGPGPDGGEPRVYVCWYDSTDDRWLEGAFLAVCSFSADGGMSFEEPIEAARLEPGSGGLTGWTELDWYEGPYAKYARHWESMAPQVAVSPKDGSVHIVVTAQPARNVQPYPLELPDGNCGVSRFGDAVPENCGEILYIASTNGGATWTPPVSLTKDLAPFGDDDLTIGQDFPAIDCEVDGTCHVIFYDTRLTPFVEEDSNYRYDVFHTSNGSPPTDAWTDAVRVTDASSINDIGWRGSLDLRAGPEGVHAIWDDRRTAEDPFDEMKEYIFTARLG